MKKESLIGSVHPLGSLQNYLYVTALSRYQGKWLFSRHKDRTTWEQQGGHIEEGETPEQAMRRELYEECGALRYTLTPLGDYEAAGTTGIFYFAEIEELGELPASEMVEISLFDEIPEKLTYPGITPQLLACAQKSINEN